MASFAWPPRPPPLTSIKPLRCNGRRFRTRVVRSIPSQSLNSAMLHPHLAFNALRIGVCVIRIPYLRSSASKDWVMTRVTRRKLKQVQFCGQLYSSRVKSDRGHHNRGVAPEGATRAATDRPVKDRKHPLYRCSGRTYLGNHLSPSSWPIDSQNRWRDRTELESNPPTSQRARGQGDSSLAEPTATIEPRFRQKEKSHTA